MHRLSMRQDGSPRDEAVVSGQLDAVTTLLIRFSDTLESEPKLIERGKAKSPEIMRSINNRCPGYDACSPVASGDMEWSIAIGIGKVITPGPLPHLACGVLRINEPQNVPRILNDNVLEAATSSKTGNVIFASIPNPPEHFLHILVRAARSDPDG